MKYQQFPGLQFSYLINFARIYIMFHVDICFSSSSGIQNLFMRWKHILLDAFDVSNDNEKSEKKNNKIQ